MEGHISDGPNALARTGLNQERKESWPPKRDWMSTSDSSERSPSKRTLSSLMAAIDRILRGESAREEPALPIVEGNLQGPVLGLIAHLDQGLPGHVDGFVVAETGGDVGELGLE